MRDSGSACPCRSPPRSRSRPTRSPSSGRSAASNAGTSPMKIAFTAPRWTTATHHANRQKVSKRPTRPSNETSVFDPPATWPQAGNRRKQHTQQRGSDGQRISGVDPGRVFEGEPPRGAVDRAGEDDPCHGADRRRQHLCQAIARAVLDLDLQVADVMADRTRSPYGRVGDPDRRRRGKHGHRVASTAITTRAVAISGHLATKSSTRLRQVHSTERADGDEPTAHRQ